MKTWKAVLKSSSSVYSISTDSALTSTSDVTQTGPESALPKEPWMQCRYVAILMGFMMKFFFFAHRIVIGVSIVKMVNQTALPKIIQESESCLELISNFTDEEYIVQKDDGEFIWTPEIQGYILGVGFLIYIFAIFPGGKLCENYGCKKVLLWSLILSSVFTFLSPFAAWCHVYFLILVQGLRGLFQGCLVPGTAILVANWAPKCERGLFYSLIHPGCVIGAIFGSICTGFLCDLPILGGWPLAFFVIGGAGLITSVFVSFYMYDNPSVHPKISPKELKYIKDNQENLLTQKRPNAPWLKMLTSVPVWALAYIYFGQAWAVTVIFLVYPTFLGTILHYPIKENGLISSLPPLTSFIFCISSGFISNLLERKLNISVNASRKLTSCVSCIGISASLLGIYFAECDRLLSAIFAMTTFGFVGTQSAGVWVVSTDMSPTFAGSINSLLSISFLANFAVPVLVGYLTNGDQTIEQWNKVFFITIFLVMSSGLVFLIFGSAEVQDWNEVSEDEKKKSNEETKF